MIRSPQRLLAAAYLLAATVLPSNAAQAQSAPAPAPVLAETAPALPLTPATPPPTWVVRGVAELQALDKVNARHSMLSLKVGETAPFGTLRIEVLACVVRPPDQPQDAATFLSITDTTGEGVNFRGWMFASQPALSMLQHPVFDIRVTGCRP